MIRNITKLAAAFAILASLGGCAVYPAGGGYYGGGYGRGGYAPAPAYRGYGGGYGGYRGGYGRGYGGGYGRGYGGGWR